MDGINEINGRYDALIDDINEIDRFIYGVFEKHGRYIPNDIWHLVTEKLLERRKKNSILIELRMLLAAIKEQKGAGNEPDPENSGVAYCEHYPKGLPVCSRCREESTLAHDKACALLAEARAEIENLQWRVSNEKAKAEAALALNDRLLRWYKSAAAPPRWRQKGAGNEPKAAK